MDGTIAPLEFLIVTDALLSREGTMSGQDLSRIEIVCAMLMEATRTLKSDIEFAFMTLRQRELSLSCCIKVSFNTRTWLFARISSNTDSADVDSKQRRQRT